MELLVEGKAAFHKQVCRIGYTAEGGVGNETERVAGRVELPGGEADRRALVALDLVVFSAVSFWSASPAEAGFVDKGRGKHAGITQDVALAM